MSNSPSNWERVEILLSGLNEPSKDIRESLMAIALIVEKNIFTQHQRDNSIDLFTSPDFSEYNLDIKNLEYIKTSLIKYLHVAQIPLPEAVFALSRFNDPRLIADIIETMQARDIDQKQLILAVLRNFPTASFKDYKSFLESLIGSQYPEVVARTITVLKRLETVSYSDST